MPMFAQEGFHVLGELQVGSPEGSAEPAHAMRRRTVPCLFFPPAARKLLFVPCGTAAFMRWRGRDSRGWVHNQRWRPAREL